MATPAHAHATTGGLDARKLRWVLRDGDRDEIEVRDWKGGEPGHNYSGGESRIADALAKGKKKRGKEDPNEGNARRVLR